MRPLLEQFHQLKSVIEGLGATVSENKLLPRAAPGIFV